MSYRTDRYRVGDKVVPFPDPFYADHIKELGPGPFTIKEVIEIPRSTNDPWDDMYGGEQSVRESVGHVQQVVLEEFPTDELVGVVHKRIFSGAFFMLVDGAVLYSNI